MSNIRSVLLYRSKLYLHLTSIFVHSLVTLTVWKLIDRTNQFKKYFNIVSWLITQRALNVKTNVNISAWNSFVCITVGDGSVNSFISYSMTTFWHSQSDSLSLSLPLSLSPAADVELFLKLRLIRYCSVFHCCFRPTVLFSFSMYCLLHREKQNNNTWIGRSYTYSVGISPSIPVSLKHFTLSPDAF